MGSSLALNSHLINLESKVCMKTKLVNNGFALGTYNMFGLKSDICTREKPAHGLKKKNIFRPFLSFSFFPSR